MLRQCWGPLPSNLERGRRDLRREKLRERQKTQFGKLTANPRAILSYLKIQGSLFSPWRAHPQTFCLGGGGTLSSTLLSTAGWNKAAEMKACVCYLNLHPQSTKTCRNGRGTDLMPRLSALTRSWGGSGARTEAHGLTHEEGVHCCRHHHAVGLALETIFA